MLHRLRGIWALLDEINLKIYCVPCRLLIIGVWQNSKFYYVPHLDLCDVCVIFTQHLAMAGVHT